MIKRVVRQISIFWIGLASLIFVPGVTTQEPAQTAGDEVPAQSDAASMPNDSTIAEPKQETEVTPDDSAQPDSGQEAFDRAIEHENNNELDKAIEDCNEALQSDPENLEYKVTRARIYFEAQHLDKVLEETGNILASDPSNVTAHVLRGKCLEISGDAQKALTEFNAAVEQNPTDWEALSARQLYYERHDQHDKALADGERITELRPDLPAGYLSQAVVDAASGDFDGVMQYSSAAIQKDPNNWLAYKMRGVARAAHGDYAQAMDDFVTALNLSPDNAAVLATRALLYRQLGEYDKSANDLVKAADLEPLDFSSKMAAADFLATCPDARFRDPQKAAKYAEAALKLAPTEPGVWRACASVAAENGDFEEAIRWTERVLASSAASPREKQLSSERLKAYQSGEPYRDNLAMLEKQRSKFRQQTSKFWTAEAMEHSGDWEGAIAVYSGVIADDPRNNYARTCRGIAYFKQKKYDLAIIDLNIAIEDKPNNSTAHYCRALAFQQTHKYSKAVDDYAMVDQNDSELGAKSENGLAWLLVTCPDDAIRDGKKAADLINRSLERQPDYGPAWDTRAAVFAENGKFDEAIQWEKKYLGRNDTGDTTVRAQQRLQLYQEHKPYRESDLPQTVPGTTASTTPAPTEK